MTKKEYKQRHYQKHKEYIKKHNNDYYYRVRKSYLQNNKDIYQKINKIHNDNRLSRRRKLLIELKIIKGNQCLKCGYNQEPRILHFHHLRDKLAEVSLLQTEKQMREEAEKCILLCPNCHAIHHLTK